MRKHLKFHLVWGLTVAALLLAQLGCSSKSSENAATVQPSASPNTATALTSASPAADATSTAASNPGAAPASASGGSSAAPANPAGAASAPGGASASKPAGSGVAAPAPAPTPHVFTIRAGTPITIFTAKTLSTKTDKDGERFIGSLARPIVDGDWVIAKKGAQVEGAVVNSDPGGRVKGRASMTVKLRSLQLADGRTVDLTTNSYTKVAKGTKKKDALKIGIG
ncbi:MAG TPA: hypothetical protein VKG02_03065, partial [Blastocatellia bacterium]|nr:hypothetical protein [Blastocatellia bacterium]